ncbi:uncharacterized protein BKCO1_6900025 [Diplodia corticola]|uniref:Uncharacterized protein n=1 Tax=Diplodia corticola TaxID=236234 RepID=A0A1J9RN71_9PEZI|nr:uncharacterized protein BKCO1_6900025 [Diplodia corticola]OJD29943.1 hypothetical protein BKCO1_6900025 [Diplodia corticola]
MANSIFSPKRKSAAMADGEAQNESSDQLLIKDELCSDCHRDPLGSLSFGRQHTPTHNPPSCTLPHDTMHSPINSPGSPILGSLDASPPPPSARITSTAKLTALRAAAATKHGTAKATASASIQPNTHLGPLDQRSQIAQRASHVEKPSTRRPTPLPTTASTPSSKQPCALNASTSEIWAPLSSESQGDSADWYAWQPRHYTDPSRDQIHKRLKTAGQKSVAQSDELDELPENEMTKVTNGIGGQAVPRKEYEDQRGHHHEQHERHDQGDAQIAPQQQQQQRREDHGNPKSNQEQQRRTQVRVDQTPPARQLTQEQQQRPAPARHHVTEEESRTTPAPAYHTAPPQLQTLSGAVPSSQNSLDVQKLMTWSLDRELLPRVRKVTHTVTTVVYDFEPTSTGFGATIETVEGGTVRRQREGNNAVRDWG